MADTISASLAAMLGTAGAGELDRLTLELQSLQQRIVIHSVSYSYS